MESWDFLMLVFSTISSYYRADSAGTVWIYWKDIIQKIFVVFVSMIFGCSYSQRGVYIDEKYKL